MNPFKPVIHKFKRRKTISFYKNNICGIDLMDYSKAEPPGYGIVLLDYYTRFVRVVISPSKSKSDIDALFDRIFRDVSNAVNKPDMIHCDQEGALVHSEYLKKHGITIYHTDFMGSPMTERVIRTLKEIIERKIYYEGGHWMNHCHNAAYEYNDRKHRSINMTPRFAWENPSDARLQVNFDVNNTPDDPKLNVGDTVVTVKNKSRFEKGYTVRWNNTPMKVIAIKHWNVWVYTLDDGNNYYIQQLQRVA